MMYPEGTNGSSTIKTSVSAAVAGKSNTGPANAVSMILNRFRDDPVDILDDVLSSVSEGFSTFSDLFNIDPDSKEWTATQPYRNVTRDFKGREWEGYPEGTGIDATQLANVTLVVMLFSLLGMPVLSKSIRFAGSALERWRTTRFRSNVLDGLDDILDEVIESSSQDTRDFAHVTSTMATMDSQNDDIRRLVEQLSNAIKFNNKSFIA